MLMQTYLMTISFPALHKWNQFDHHHSTRVDNGFEHGVIYSKILVFKQVTCHSLLSAQSNLTNKYTLVGDTARSRNSFASEVGGGPPHQLPNPYNHSYKTSLAELSHSTIQILGFYKRKFRFFGPKLGPLTNSKVALIVTGVESECENNTTATEPSANGRAQISELPFLMWQKKI